MKKKNSELIKKISFGKKKNLQKLSKKRKYALFVFFRIAFKLNLRKVFLTKNSILHKYFDFFKILIFKKEFFLFKNFFLKFQLNNNINLLMYPHFVFEKQFLFKFNEYQQFLSESVNYSMFLKKKYNFSKNPGLEYLTFVDKMVENIDPKDPLFYIKDEFFSKNDELIKFDSIINFNLNLNFNIFFFILVDIYKILIFLHFKNLIN